MLLSQVDSRVHKTVTIKTKKLKSSDVLLFLVYVLKLYPCVKDGVQKQIVCLCYSLLLSAQSSEITGYFKINNLTTNNFDTF